MENHKKDFKKMQNHFKESGLIFVGSEIYGGLANTYDYGPLGVAIINQLKKVWWANFIDYEVNNYGLDSKILLNPLVWKASGHLDNFVDPLIENKINGKRYRADQIVETLFPEQNIEKMNDQQLSNFIKNKVPYYDDSNTEWSEIKKFNLMFSTKQGVIENQKNQIYLRPETAQGIFINFLNIKRAMRAKVPFGIGQIGKAFRNEITPGNYIFRTREFEQMELEYFVKPDDDEIAYKYYVKKSYDFLTGIGLKKTSLRLAEHNQDQLAHYAKSTTDIEFNFPFGWGELMGISNRTDYDLKQHMVMSKQSFEYLDPYSQEKYVPYVIEPSLGVDRLLLAILIDAFEVEKINDEERIVLKINFDLAPYQIAILPLVKKYHSSSAKKIYQKLIKKGWRMTYDEAGSIGKRYRRQDSIGTPFVITIIDQSETNNEATIRHRDTMEQVTINLNDLEEYLNKHQK